MQNLLVTLGVAPFLLALFGLTNFREKGKFFLGLLVGTLLFAFPTFFWEKSPYLLNLPFISTAQPSRLMVIIDFCLAVFAAIGLDKIGDQKIPKRFFNLKLLILGGSFCYPLDCCI